MEKFVTTYSEYAQQKTAFFEKHGEHMDAATYINNTQTYAYTFDDLAIWREVIGTTEKEVQIDVEGVVLTTKARFKYREFWSTEFPAHRICYELLS